MPHAADANKNANSDAGSMSVVHQHKARKSTLRSNQPNVLLSNLQNKGLNEDFSEYVRLYVRLFCLVTSVGPETDSPPILEDAFVQLYLMSTVEKSFSFSKYLLRHFYRRQFAEVMDQLLYSNQLVQPRRPQNDFRKKIQFLDQTKVIFHNASCQLRLSPAEVRTCPGLRLTFTEDPARLTEAFEKNLAESAVFEFKILADMRRCLAENSDVVSDFVFLESGNTFSHFMDAMLEYEFLSVDELDTALRVWDRYLGLFLERFNEFDEESCFDIVRGLRNAFRSLSDFFDLRFA